MPHNSHRSPEPVCQRLLQQRWTHELVIEIVPKQVKLAFGWPRQSNWMLLFSMFFPFLQLDLNDLSYLNERLTINLISWLLSFLTSWSLKGKKIMVWLIHPRNPSLLSDSFSMGYSCLLNCLMPLRYCSCWSSIFATSLWSFGDAALISSDPRLDVMMNTASLQ